MLISRTQADINISGYVNIRICAHPVAHEVSYVGKDLTAFKYQSERCSKKRKLYHLHTYITMALTYVYMCFAGQMYVLPSRYTACAGVNTVFRGAP